MKALFFVGMFILALINIIGIGVFLYAWGAQGMDLGLAAWEAFKIYAGGIALGGSLIVVGILNQ